MEVQLFTILLDNLSFAEKEKEKNIIIKVTVFRV